MEKRISDLPLSPGAAPTTLIPDRLGDRDSPPPPARACRERSSLPGRAESRWHCWSENGVSIPTLAEGRSEEVITLEVRTVVPSEQGGGYCRWDGTFLAKAYCT